jgi:hypothetical protein
MSTFSGNSCDIITLFPLGVSCSVVNSYSPQTTNGAVYLIITGATPPYKITWTNGSQNQNLIGVGVGDYTAYVTDYYGDFTAKTTCTVGTQTFLLEEFFNCTEPTNKLYYLPNINILFPSGDTFTLASQSGCWVSNGLKNYSGQTYFNYTATTTSGPFEDCVTCLPTTPTYENTSGLCMNFTSFNGLVDNFQTQFFSAGTYNGLPSWTSSTPTQRIYFNPANNSWNVLGWDYPGVPNLPQPQSPPIGIWRLIGATGELNVTQGNCGTIITPTIQKTNPICVNSTNGLIKVSNVFGGTSPYTYSLNDITYQNSNIFNNLPSGNYNVYVKDVIGNTSSTLVTLSPQQQITNYVVSLQFVPSTPTSVDTGTYKEVTGYWRVGVTPSLPPNRVVNLTIYNTTSMSAGTASDGVPLLVYSNITGTTGTSQYITSSIQTTTNSYPNTVSCHPNFYTTGITRTYNVSLSGTGVVGGTIYQKVTVSNLTTSCITYGGINDTISIGNITLINQQPCETINTNVIPISLSISKYGSLFATPVNQTNNQEA